MRRAWWELPELKAWLARTAWPERREPRGRWELPEPLAQPELLELSVRPELREPPELQAWLARTDWPELLEPRGQSELPEPLVQPELLEPLVRRE